MLHKCNDAAIDELMCEATAAKKVPGAVVYVGGGDTTEYRKAFGSRQLWPDAYPMLPESVFDLASLTKPVVSATAISLLAQRRRLFLTDHVADYLTEFANGERKNITIEQLLLHTSGLPAENPVEAYLSGRAAAMRRICEIDLVARPGTKFEYSDIGYILLGEIVNRLDARGLQGFAGEEIFSPLEMKDSCFNPGAELRKRCAATSMREGEWLLGKVHDPRAHALGGVSGHAGLFGTADDLASYCRAILNGGLHNGKRVFADSLVHNLTCPRLLPGGGLRSYAFDITTQFSEPWLSVAPPGTTFGHTGFTGTMMWIDAVNDQFVVLLTNAVHMPTRLLITELRRELLRRIVDLGCSRQKD